ncbi:MAG TPA: divergent polysaccharide deacetylase family protein [Myxococcales bacterium]|nr:divergent polysaccharide deacetylase family protein [Myxococcales bacterium]
MTASLEPYLRVSDSPEKIRRALAQRLAKLPPEISKHIQGLSNHQGSRFSASHKAMTVLMNELKKRKLFYVDSRTTAQTVADSVAAEQGVAFARRHVFLDNVAEVPAITVQLKELTELALQQGFAIAIGHPYPQTASALAVWIRKQKGILQVVPVHHLVNTP